MPRPHQPSSTFRWVWVALFATVLIILSTIPSTQSSPTSHPSTSNTHTTSEHSDNWAVILSTSKYWFNYRHNSDALTLYHLIKKQGIPDSNIILMLPEDVACTPKNVVPATVFNTPGVFPHGEHGMYNEQSYNDRDNFSHAGQLSSSSSRKTHGDNLYDESSIEIDYKGDDVTVENFLRVLTGRHDPSTPRNKRLMSNENSNVFIYSSSHSGSGFTKFRDAEILTARDLEYAVNELYHSKRFKNLYITMETCQAATMVEGIATPNVITSASSLRGENSYSHGSDPVLGLSIVDKYTYYLHQFYDATKEFTTGGSWPIGEQVDAEGNIVDDDGRVLMKRRDAVRGAGGKTYPPNMLDMFNTFTYNRLHSSYYYRTELYEFSSVFSRAAANGGSGDQVEQGGQEEVSPFSLIQFLRLCDLPEAKSSFVNFFNKNGIPAEIANPVLVLLGWLGLPDDMSGATDDHTVLALGGTVKLDLRKQEKDIRNVSVLDFFGASLRTMRSASAQHPAVGTQGGFDFDLIAKMNQEAQKRSSLKKNFATGAFTHLSSIQLEEAEQQQRDTDKKTAKQLKEEAYRLYAAQKPQAMSWTHLLTTSLTHFLPYVYLVSVLIVAAQVGYFVFADEGKSRGPL